MAWIEVSRCSCGVMPAAGGVLKALTAYIKKRSTRPKLPSGTESLSTILSNRFIMLPAQPTAQHTAQHAVSTLLSTLFSTLLSPLLSTLLSTLLSVHCSACTAQPIAHHAAQYTAMIVSHPSWGKHSAIHLDRSSTLDTQIALLGMLSYSIATHF